VEWVHAHPDRYRVAAVVKEIDTGAKMGIVEKQPRL